MTGTALRPATADDIEAIKALAVANAMFEEDEVAFFDEVIAGFLDGSLEDDVWVVAEAEGRLVGAAYLAPEPFGDRVWNLLFLASRDDAHGAGVGTQLVEAVERHLAGLGPDRALVLIVETSDTDQYAPARAFYERRGFVRESTIRDYYGPGDAKVTYWKAVNRDAS